MEKAVSAITDYLIRKEYISEDTREIYEYCFSGWVSELVTYSTLLVLSYLIDRTFFMMLFVAAFVYLRKGTGGYHAKTPTGCYLLSIAVSVLISETVCKWLHGRWAAELAVVIFAGMIIFLYAPVNHENLNLNAAERMLCRKRSRKRFCILAGIILVSALVPMWQAGTPYLAAAAGADAIGICAAKIMGQEVNTNMKKKRKRSLFMVFLLSVLLLFLFGSCAKKHSGTEGTDGEEEVIFLNEIIHVNKRGSALENKPKIPEEDADNYIRLGFFYKGKKPEITFVRTDNPKADALFRVLLQDEDTIEPYRGYRAAQVQFGFDYSLLEPGESVAVNSVTLSVNGEEVTLDTKDRLILTRHTEERERETLVVDTTRPPHPFGWGHTTAILSGHGYANVDMTYTVKRDVTVEGLEFADWLTITNATVYVNESRRGKLEELLPLSLYEGELLQIELTAAPEEGHPFSDFITELWLHYTEKDAGKRTFPIQCEGELSPDVFPYLIEYMHPDGEDARNILFLEDYTYWRKLTGRDAGNCDLQLFFLYHDEEKKPYIEVTGMESGSAAAALVSYSLGMDSLGAYGGYQFGYLALRFDLSETGLGTVTDPGKLYLRVGGEEITVDLAGKAAMEPAREEVPASTSLNMESRNQVYFSEGEEIKEIQLVHASANEPVTLQKPEVSGPMAFSKIKVVVNEAEIGTVENAFPLKLKAGDVFEIIGIPDDGALDPFAGISDIKTILPYTDGDGKEQTVTTEQNISMYNWHKNSEKESRERYETFMKHLLKKIGK